MNILPFVASLFITASVAATPACDFFNNNNLVHIGNSDRHVRLMKIDPARVNTKKMELFFKASEKNYSSGIASFKNSATSSDLGMNGVPVLDQGQYGTCVTFSSTAALDAKLGKGDFISQECSLGLDLGAGNNYWEGADYPSQIIDPLKANGVVSRSGCNSQYADDSFTISAENYKLLADKAQSEQVAKVSYAYSAQANLAALKVALKAGHRVLIAFLVDGSDQEAVQGFDIKVGGAAFTGGLWACQQRSSVNHCKSSNAGHEVLAIGYDDAQQLVKIRNSWSAEVGESGDYYMSYTFFNAMAVDQTVVN